METKTPKFDKLMDEIFEKLFPHVRVCKWKGMHEHCQGDFEITAEDIEFYKMLRAVPPNYCPTCRRMRRMTHINLARLHKHKCQAPGHEEMMISVLPAECPFKVFDYHYFIGDEFDPFSYGIEYKKGESPMETLFGLRKKFPMPSFLNRDPSSVNSEYTNGGRNLKNGYYVMAGYSTENAWYCLMLNRTKNVMDAYNLLDAELVYEAVFSDHLYKSCYIYFSNSCTDSMFLFDCRNCSNCFGCVNLRNKKHCVFNEQYSEKEYQDFINSIFPLTRENITLYKSKFWDLIKKLPMNGPRNVMSTNVVGVNLRSCKNLFDVTDSDNSEHIRHADSVIRHKDSMDVSFSGGGSSLLYMATNNGFQSSWVKFSVSCKFCTNSEFIFNSKNLDHCFMCFGLQNKSYCILNKQYEKEEYFKIVDEIKSEMLKRGEYEDGLDLRFSAQAYNFSIAHGSFPLENETITKLGGYAAKEPEIDTGGLEMITPEQLPKTIEETTNDILDKAIKCKKTGRVFRITPSELEFYRKMKLPIPDIHPSFRLREKRNLAPNGKKYKTNCAKCTKKMESLFNPAEGFLLYCEDCYKREVY